MDIKILVATHKKYWMPGDDIYIPIHVGKLGQGDLGYIGDDTNDNISSKHANYCELTALYWAWKNLTCEYIGLCHYRRYFVRNKYACSLEGLKDNILSKGDYCDILKKYDVILPKINRFKTQTLYEQYDKDHYKKDLDNAFTIIKRYFPDYANAYNEVMNGKEGYFFNMFVMKKGFFNSYCKWLFKILFELEKITDTSEYDEYQTRIYGFLSERLFNIWLKKNALSVCEIPVTNLEEKSYVNRFKWLTYKLKYKITGKY